MRFLLDVNVGSTIARALKALGYDCVRAALTNPRDPDETLLDIAVREDRIIVTYDSDFGTMLFLEGATPPPAIIYIRYEPTDIRDVLPKLLPLLDFEILRDHMTVISPQHTRRTPFPKTSEHNA